MFGILATDTESSMDQLQQTGSLRKHRMGFIQPLRQIELQGERDVVTVTGLLWVYIMFLHCVASQRLTFVSSMKITSALSRCKDVTTSW